MRFDSVKRLVAYASGERRRLTCQMQGHGKTGRRTAAGCSALDLAFVTSLSLHTLKNRYLTRLQSASNEQNPIDKNLAESHKKISRRSQSASTLLSVRACGQFPVCNQTLTCLGFSSRFAAIVDTGSIVTANEDFPEELFFHVDGLDFLGPSLAQQIIIAPRRYDRKTTISVS